MLIACSPPARLQRWRLVHRLPPVGNLQKCLCRLHWSHSLISDAEHALFQNVSELGLRTPGVVLKSWVAWPWRSHESPWPSHSQAARRTYPSPAPQPSSPFPFHLSAAHHPPAATASLFWPLLLSGPRDRRIWALCHAEIFLSLEKCFSANLSSVWYRCSVFVFRWKRR